ncbi:MAG: hypothetical protein KAR20_29845, partial [Candidatus Heimdallarchaeota archaeon]|nr:hypothetical protein [Candidatus Heimdallarchaeota archaeon]
MIDTLELLKQDPESEELKDLFDGVDEFFNIVIRLSIRDLSKKNKNLKVPDALKIKPGETKAKLLKQLNNSPNLTKLMNFFSQLRHLIEKSASTKTRNELIDTFIRSSYNRFPVIWRSLKGNIAEIELRSTESKAGTAKVLKPKVIETAEDSTVYFSWQDIDKKCYKNLILVEGPFDCLQIVRALKFNEQLNKYLVVAYGGVSQADNANEIIQYVQSLCSGVKTFVIADTGDSGVDCASHIAEKNSNTTAVYLPEDCELDDIDEYLRSFNEEDKWEELKKILTQTRPIKELISITENLTTDELGFRLEITDLKKVEQVNWRQIITSGQDKYFEILYDNIDYYMHIFSGEDVLELDLFTLDSEIDKDVRRKLFSKLGLSDTTKQLYTQVLEILKSKSKSADLILWSRIAIDNST